MDVNNFKNTFLNDIKIKVTTTSFNTWFKDIDFYFEGNNIYLVTPHESCKKHLINNYKDVIEDLIIDINSNLNFIDIINKDDKIIKQNEPEDIIEIIDNDTKEDYNNYSKFNPKYTFDTYIVGDSNKLAYSASLSVAQKPGKLYNPLFLYGNSGLGKTHLMHAIGNYIQKNSNKKVLYITTEQFVNDLILMYKKEGSEDNIGYIELFRKKYRDVDVLMIDDIQFLGGAIKSQQEFTNTFNSLYDNEKQIIICSDRSVDDLKLLEDRLKTRFNWGLKVNISPPDYELKVNIIKQKIKTSDLVIDLSDEIINYVASNCGSDVRNIEGFITRLIAYQAIMNIPKLTLEDAIEALKEYTNSGLFTPNSIGKIQQCVSKYFNLSVDDLKGKKRNATITNARHIAFYLCRMMTDESYVRIGAEFGNRDHATAIHSFEKIKKDMEKDKELVNQIIEIKSKISEQ